MILDIKTYFLFFFKKKILKNDVGQSTFHEKMRILTLMLR